MQRQRVELVPVAEALADLPGPVQALIPSPPTQRHFTRADQVKPACRGPRIGPQSRFHGADDGAGAKREKTMNEAHIELLRVLLSAPPMDGSGCPRPREGL